MKNVPLFESELWLAFKRDVLSKYSSKAPTAQRYSLVVQSHALFHGGGSVFEEYPVVRADSKANAIRWGRLYAMFMNPPGDGYRSWSAWVQK